MNRKKKSGHFLFHDLLKKLRSRGVRKKHLLCAVSGGMDSVALVSVLNELKSVLELKLSVVHVHHGEADTKKQTRFRHRALKLVKLWCLKNQVPFYGFELVPAPRQPASSLSTQPFPGKLVGNHLSGFQLPRKRESTPGFVFKIQHSSPPGTEADLRRFRYRVFRVLFQKVRADFLVLAHHADDLLHTRLIRLIRGSGPVGLRAMSFQRGLLLRPFLSTARKHIADFAKQQQLKWTEDPSNQNPHHNFRNWIRHQWLKDLENKKPGSTKALFRSLSLIVRKQNPRQILSFYQQKGMDSRGINIPLLQKLTEADQSQVLALFIHQKGLKNYSATHVQEILKRLRTKKPGRFTLLGRDWQIHPPPGRLEVLPPPPHEKALK